MGCAFKVIVLCVAPKRARQLHRCPFCHPWQPCRRGIAQQFQFTHQMAWNSINPRTVVPTVDSRDNSCSPDRCSSSCTRTTAGGEVQAATAYLNSYSFTRWIRRLRWASKRRCGQRYVNEAMAGTRSSQWTPGFCGSSSRDILILAATFGTTCARTFQISCLTSCVEGCGGVFCILFCRRILQAMCNICMKYCN